MEIAVRSFISDVSHCLEASLSDGCGAGGWEARCRRQLEQLRLQLQQLLLRFPTLRPSDDEAGADDVTYDDTEAADAWYDDTGPELQYDDAGGQQEAAREAFYDDTGGGDPAEDVYEEPSERLAETEKPQEEYDELSPALPGRSPEREASCDDRAPLVQQYLPMSGKVARILGLGDQKLQGKPAPSGPSVSAADPEVASLQSQTSEESAPAEQMPATRLSATARRWGRLQLRQESRIWSQLYRPYWAGLADGCLYLYRRETDPAQKRAICLGGYEVRQPPPGADVTEKRRPSCFELVKPGGKTHQLLALTPKDARQWMAAMEAEGVLVGRSEMAPVEEAPPRPRPPPPGPDPTLAATAASAAAAAAVTASVPLKPPPAEPVEEELYYEPEQEEEIYEDISWPAAGLQRPPSSVQAAPDSPEECIYDIVGTPGDAPPEPSRPAPVLQSAGRTTLGRTGPLPSVPVLLGDPGSPPPPPLPARGPLAPTAQPPVPPPPQRSPAEPAAPPPPQRDPGVPARPTVPPPERCPPEPTRPPPPPPPTRGPATALRAQSPQERVPSPATDVIEEELYDELGDVGGQSTLPPQSDPFYNVLEPEYLQPRHPSPVPVKTGHVEEPPDEGYGNSSGGSEADSHAPAKESHYKTLPRQPRPVRPAAMPATPTAETDAAPVSSAGPDRPKRPTELPVSGRSGGGGASGSVADAIRRLNRQSVGEEEATRGRPAPRQAASPVSAELARRQALIAGGVRALSPVGKPAKPTILPPKPGAAASKPGTAAGKPKTKPAPPTRQDAPPATGTGGRPAGGPQPNKSAVYKVMQRMSDSGTGTAGRTGRREVASAAVATEPEEDDVYAEIDDDAWRA